MVSETIAYLYEWKHISGKWYVGSRTASGCHPNDGYICSSQVVKPLVIQNPEEWTRVILCVGDPTFIRSIEGKLLSSVDAAKDPMSFNRNNADGKFTTAGTKHTAIWKKKTSVRSTALNRKLIEDGTHIFIARNPSAILARHGLHHFQDKEFQRMSVELQRKLVIEGTHHWKSANHANLTGERNRRLISEKTHPFAVCVECPHCNKTGQKAAMHRFHFDNCKAKS